MFSNCVKDWGEGVTYVVIFYLGNLSQQKNNIDIIATIIVYRKNESNKTTQLLAAVEVQMSGSEKVNSDTVGLRVIIIMHNGRCAEQ